MSTEALRRIEEIKREPKDRGDGMCLCGKCGSFVGYVGVERSHSLCRTCADAMVAPLCRALEIALDELDAIGDGCRTVDEAIRQIEEVLK